ncbi:MAG: hypothetical protein CMP22_04865 [Rickettsiales bacterium]|nr:hypothetical protein [Rickettsiales bacterium]
MIIPQAILEPIDGVTIRQASEADAHHILKAHRASIRGEGSKYYDADIVKDWHSGLTEDGYIRAMRRGEIYFIAIRDDDGLCLGFSGSVPEKGDAQTEEALNSGAQYENDEGIFHVATYVHPEGIGKGIGAALLKCSELSARERGATKFAIDSSVNAKPFYEKFGFRNLGSHNHEMSSGKMMKSYRMEKDF